MDEFPDRVALVNGVTHESLTYRDMKRLVLRVASALRSHGLKKGDTVAMFLQNCPEYVLFMIGSMCLGVTITLANPKFTEEELRRQLQDSCSSYIFTSKDIAYKAKAATSKLKFIRGIFVNGESPGCTPFKALAMFTGQLYDVTQVAFKPAEDIVFLPYSSGTTGAPKGVMLTHTNFLCNLYVTKVPGVQNESSVQETWLNVLPFYHLAGLSGLFLTLAIGGKVVSISRFQPRLFLELTEKYKVTSFNLVPPLALALIQSPLTKGYDLTSLREIKCGSAPVSRELELELAQKLGTEVKNSYGLTETSPIVMVVPSGNNKPGTAGKAAPNTETQIVDVSTGEILGPKKVGELWFRGPQVMKGYLNRPDSTRDMVDADGWLHTGDLAYYDDNKYFYVVDRIKELIKYKGTQVAPAELEGVLLTHPDIMDAGVTGLPDTDAGELPCAFVKKTGEASLSEEEVKNFVAKKLAPYKYLRGGVRFVDEIPKTSTGKIMRRVLKEMAIKSRRQSKL